MEVFFINLDTFKPNLNEEFYKKYIENRHFMSDKRKIEFCVGRYLIRHIAKTRYDVKNREIIEVNKKPIFRNSYIHFNLSHSKNIVMAVFDKAAVGIDIETMKERNFKTLKERYNLRADENSKETFYKLWTQYEARIKLQAEPVTILTREILDGFMLTIASGRKINEHIKIYEIKDGNLIFFQNF